LAFYDFSNLKESRMDSNVIVFIVPGFSRIHKSMLKSQDQKHKVVHRPHSAAQTHKLLPLDSSSGYELEVKYM
jgi:hypothetical protein